MQMDPGSAAEACGMAIGDRIVSINDLHMDAATHDTAATIVEKIVGVMVLVVERPGVWG